MTTQLPSSLVESLKLADELRLGRESMIEPQDLPGRYGRVVSAIDRVLQAVGCSAALGGGWAVWRHGYVGRVTQDVDVILPADHVDEFLCAASVSGFELYASASARWPKLLHKETSIDVDVLPEGQRPGTTARPAPTTIAHPTTLGAEGTVLRYVHLPGLIELKLAAGRTRDESDVIELIHANPDSLDAIRSSLAAVHDEYVRRWEALRTRAREELD